MNTNSRVNSCAHIQTKLRRLTGRTMRSMYNSKNSTFSGSHRAIPKKLSCPCGPVSHQLSAVWPIHTPHTCAEKLVCNYLTQRDNSLHIRGPTFYRLLKRGNLWWPDLHCTIPLIGLMHLPILMLIPKKKHSLRDYGWGETLPTPRNASASLWQHKSLKGQLRVFSIWHKCLLNQYTPNRKTETSQLGALSKCSRIWSRSSPILMAETNSKFLEKTWEDEAMPMGQNLPTTFP